MSDKLLPCPFCGGEAALRFGAFFKGYAMVKCKKCGASTMECYSRNNAENARIQAAQAWNTRKPMDRIVERLENNSFWTEPTYDIDGYSNDDEIEVISLQRAIEIIKEEMG